MKFADKRLFSGMLIGALLGIGGFGIYAHAGHADGGGMHNGNFRSIAGSPEELGQRARLLGEHICATINASTDCPLIPFTEKAANELSAMQAPYALGQGRLHESLTAATFNRAEFDQIQTGQAQAIQASSTRYMQFLADAAAALTPEQRQMFSHPGHAKQ